MKISNINNFYQYSPKSSNTFKTLKGLNTNSSLKKAFPKAMYVLLPLSILCTMCTKTENRVSGKTDFNNSQIEYFNVKKTTKDAIESSLNKFAKDAKTINFLDAVDIDITKKFKNLDSNDAFRCALKERENSKYTGGISFYSDSAVPRKICIQENAHDEKPNGKDTQATLIKSTLMHEIGHQFDEFYGHNSKSIVAKKWNSVQARKAQEDSLSVYTSPKEKDLEAKIEYVRQNGLSDRKEFKEAYYKDLLNIYDVRKSGNGILTKKLSYFVPNFEKIESITLEKIDLLDARRSETYAELFSLAVGEDNGDKDAFLSNFSNSYKIVKKDIEKYLGIK